MLAPQRLLNAIVNAVESRSGEIINQSLLDELTKKINTMCQNYVKIYGYSKPDFTAEYSAEYEHSVIIVPNNETAIKMINSYYDTVGETEDGS